MDNRDEMPIGFSFSLSMHEKAMERYSGMDEAQKKQVVDAARQAGSKKEMEQLVNRLERGESIF